MLVTKKEEAYYLDGVKKLGKVYVKVPNFTAMIDDKTVLMYIEIGVVKTEMDNLAGEEVTRYEKLITKSVSVHEDDFKNDLNRLNLKVNSKGDNAVIGTIKEIAEAIILDDIKTNPDNYFSIKSTGFEVV